MVKREDEIATSVLWAGAVSVYGIASSRRAEQD